MSEDLHVIFGTGPVGSWIATTLAGQGARVRAVNRSGKPNALMPAGVEVVSADASDPAQAIEAAGGASVVYQALNPPYHQWSELFPGLQAGAMAAAKAANARYVSIDNLYMYGLVDGAITESSPIAPNSRKGELRARMAADVLAAHTAGDIRAAILDRATTTARASPCRHSAPGPSNRSWPERAARPPATQTSRTPSPTSKTSPPQPSRLAPPTTTLSAVSGSPLTRLLRRSAR